MTIGITKKRVKKFWDDVFHLQQRKKYKSKYKLALEEIREDLEQDITCESRECGCDDYGECLKCIKETILDKINEVLKCQ